MASVNLDVVYIHLHSDPWQHVTAEVFGGFTSSVQVVGEVRAYARGRRRVVRRPGRFRPIEVNFPTDRATLYQLEQWAGETVMLRDPVGRLVYGVYLKVGQVEIGGGDWVDVALQVEPVSASVED